LSPARQAIQTKNPWLLIPVGLGFLVLFQLTISVGNGLRINAADILVGPLALTFLISRIRNRDDQQTWLIPHLPIWLGALSVLLVVAMILGRQYTGEWSGWGLLNRLVGWFVLLAYFLAGSWVCQNLGQRGRACLSSALIVGLCCAVLLFIIHLVVSTTFDSNALQSLTAHRLEPAQLAGFSDNPNAFGLVLLVGASFLLVRIRLATSRLAYCLILAGLGVVVIGVWFTASRAAWLALIAVLGFAGFRRYILIRNLWPMLLGLVVLSAVAALASPDVLSFASQKLINIVNLMPRDGVGASMSDNERLGSIVQAIDLWQSYPVFGAGLGTYLVVKTSVNGVIIHNSAVWLLTETGIIGLVLFTGFFLRFFLSLTNRAGSNEAYPDASQSYARAVVLIMVGVAVMSQFHDLLYQRLPWLILGTVSLIPSKTGSE